MIGQNLFSRLFGPKTCSDCDGRGRWEERKPDGFMVELVSYYCETCKGTGIKVKDQDIDDFDLGGVGVTEYDGDEDD